MRVSIILENGPSGVMYFDSCEFINLYGRTIEGNYYGIKVRDYKL